MFAGSQTPYRFLIRTVQFLSLVFVLDYSIGTCLKTLYLKKTNGEDYRLIYAILKTNEDIIILGDSRAQNHYVPSVIEKELKLSCFNAGRAGAQSIIYHYAIFNSIIRRYKPKIFIINISPYELLKVKNNFQYEILSILLPFVNNNKTIRQITELRSPFEAIKNMLAITGYPVSVLGDPG